MFCGPESRKLYRENQTEFPVLIVQEVQAAAAHVLQVTTRQLAALGGVTAEAAAEGLHCRALGSYCRGKEATGDVDMMIVPGNSWSHICIRCVFSLPHSCEILDT